MLSDQRSSVQALALGAGIVHKAFMPKGLTPNYGKGKSGILLYLWDAGSRPFRRRILLQHDCRLPIEGTDARISVDSNYKHLGTTSASNASLAIEIAQRRLKHGAALGPIRKALFARGSMPQRKLLYVDRLATSLLTVHSGAWEPLS